MRKRKLVNALLMCSILSVALWYDSYARQNVVDSSLLARISALEEQQHDQRKGEEHFLLVGLATFGFVADKTVKTVNGMRETSKANSLADAAHYEFSPMLLWRHGKKFLLEFEPSFDGNTLNVNWADISYFAAPGLIIRAGYFVLPFGIYNKRLAAGWINKLASDPIGVADVPPSTDFGIEVEGGFPMGNMKWSYDIALTNGMQLLPDGELQKAGVTDNNNNKTLSGRLALLPFSNSSLELGISGLVGKVGDAGSVNKNARAHMYALDLNYVNTFNPIMVNVKGQFNYIHVNDQQYINPRDSTQSYTFDNTVRTGFIQASIRPVSLKNKLLKNLELAFRYANFTTPKNSLWGQKTNELDFGLAYWLSWRTVLKFTYETNKSTSIISPHLGGDGADTKSQSLYLQFAIQL